MLNFSLEQGYALSTMLAVAAAAILLASVFYRRAFRNLHRRQWIILLALRSLAIVLIVLLLFRPTFSYTKELTELPAVIFVLDTSSSMSIADDAAGNRRFDQARKHLSGWCDQLKDDFSLHLIEFSERAKPLHDLKQLATLSPDGRATSLSRALVSAAKLLPRDEVEAVILLSDGIHNSARSPLRVAVKMGVIVHTVGVGSSLRGNASYRDLQITGLNCPQRLMLNNKARITATVEGFGLAGHVATVVLEEDGREIQQAELTIDGIEGSQEVVFEFRPTAKGRHAYNVRVAAAGQEKIKENNQRSAVSTVIEPGIRVLYIEGTLRAEYGALVDRFLAKDPDLEFCAMVQTRPNVFLTRTNIDGLKLDAIPADAETVNSFDVFIIGDLDSSYLKPAQQELIARRVRHGAGLILLGGYHALGPGGYARTTLGKLLPVELGDRDVGQITESFLPRLTPEGVRHPIFANIDRFFPTAAAEAKEPGLPLLQGCTRVMAARPAGTVLAVCALAEGTPPVLAVGPVGAGRAAVFTGDTTRKWQQGPRVLDRESPFLRFWGQTVRWLAGRADTVEATAGVVAATDKGYYEPEEIVRISAVVRNEKGEAATDVTVTAKVRPPSGGVDEVALSAVAGPGGHYSGTYEPDAVGSFQVETSARVGELTVTAPKNTFEVGRPNLEFEKLDLDEKMLAKIASETGGRYYHITTADHLIDQLDSSGRKKRIIIERRLYWPPGFWLIFVAAISTEWILRRKWRLR